MLKRLFSVMRKRDDLPEMKLPLALVFMLGTALFSCAGARLLISSADASGTLAHAAGIAASLVFFPAAVCLYAMIILLWRRYASLLTTPLTAAMLYFTVIDAYRAREFHFTISVIVTVAVTVTVLMASYTFAVSMISRETRFRRVAAVTLSYALCISLSLTAYAGTQFGSLENIASAVYSSLKNTLSALYYEAGSAVETHECSRMAREIASSLPAYIGMLSLILAALSDFLAKRLFRVLDCEDVFISLSREITMPKAFAYIYIFSAVMFFLSSGSDFALLYIMAKSLTYIMILPCAAVGIGEILKKPEDEYFSANKRNITALIAVFIAVMFLGIRFAVVTASVCGAAKTIVKKTEHGNAV